jgi:hypothetical protein
MSEEKTNKTATYVLAGFGGVAALCLILWIAGVFKTPTQEQLDNAGSEKPLGGSAEEIIYGK